MIFRSFDISARVADLSFSTRSYDMPVTSGTYFFSFGMTRFSHIDMQFIRPSDEIQNSELIGGKGCNLVKTHFGLYFG